MELTHDSKAHRFFCIVEGMECYVEYMVSEDGTWDFFHTFVPLKLRGQGIARQIYDEIVKYLDADNIKVLASCSYAEKFFNEEKNSKYYAEQHN